MSWVQVDQLSLQGRAGWPCLASGWPDLAWALTRVVCRRFQPPGQCFGLPKSAQAFLVSADSVPSRLEPGPCRWPSLWCSGSNVKSAKPDIGLLLTYIGQPESLADRATVATPGSRSLSRATAARLTRKGCLSSLESNQAFLCQVTSVRLD